MFEQSTEFWLRLLPVFAMVALVFMTRIGAQRYSRRRLVQDMQCVAAGLRVELKALRDLYETNIETIEQSGNVLLSARSATTFYRGNMARLSVLGEPLVVALVTTFTFNDMIETQLSASCIRPNGGFAYKVDPSRPKIQRLREKYRRGCEQIDLTLQQMQQLAGEPLPIYRAARQLTPVWGNTIARLLARAGELAQRVLRRGGGRSGIQITP